MLDLFVSAQLGHGTCLVMLNTCNYVLLRWNSTFFFIILKTILLRLGFGSVKKHLSDIAQKHVADIAQKRVGLLYVAYMAGMA